MKALMNIKNKKKVGLKKIWSKAVLLKNAGFTLIELLVVLAIFAIVMSVALFDQAGLNSNILVTNLAYETALAVREAQTYGIGVRATGADIFDKGYGAYFDTNKMNQVVVFGDSDGSNSYTEGANPSELQSLYEIKNQRGNKIWSICVGSPQCKILSTGQKLSIMFKRPNPEATFHIFDASGEVLPPPTGPAVIVVNNVEGTNCRAIVVEVTGQIRVENSTGGNCSNTIH